MTDQEIDQMIALQLGWQGCLDANCGYRKAHHLHKDGKSWFFEWFTDFDHRVPGFCSDHAAMHWAASTLPEGKRWRYAWEVAMLAICDGEYPVPGVLDVEDVYLALQATPRQKAEAFLQTLNLWPQDQSKTR